MSFKTYLEKRYEKSVPSLKADLNIKNSWQLPRLIKAVVNLGLSDNRFEPQKLAEIKKNLTLILGQIPCERKAKKSISAFKLRQGQVNALLATLRGKRMFAFLDKLLNIALPRQRDFRGLKESALDRQGVLHIGISDLVVFPDISPEEIKHSSGLSVDIISSAKNREQAKKLFEALGVVFESEESRKMREEAIKKAKEEAKMREEKIRLYKQQLKEQEETEEAPPEEETKEE